MLELIFTSDGSKTIFNPEVGETYHSRHGALQESRHVFLNSGLRYFIADKNIEELRVLEVGFGTGLNFLLSAEFCLQHHFRMDYVGIEVSPLNQSLISQTGYDDHVTPGLWESFLEKYPSSLKNSVRINNQSTLKVAHCALLEFQSQQSFDVLYFDAFAAVHQPEIWSHESLAHVCQFLKIGGVFVTYAITGNLKRSLKSLGFTIEKIPGALGKREMLRAQKTYVS